MNRNMVVTTKISNQSRRDESTMNAESTMNVESTMKCEFPDSIEIEICEPLKKLHHR
jgi:hypothetical protein